MLLILGGRGDHDDHEHDNLTPVDSTPVNCGEDKSCWTLPSKLESIKKKQEIKVIDLIY